MSRSGPRGGGAAASRGVGSRDAPGPGGCRAGRRERRPGCEGWGRGGARGGPRAWRSGGHWGHSLGAGQAGGGERSPEARVRGRAEAAGRGEGAQVCASMRGCMHAWVGTWANEPHIWARRKREEKERLRAEEDRLEKEMLSRQCHRVARPAVTCLSPLFSSSPSFVVPLPYLAQGRVRHPGPPAGGRGSAPDGRGGELGGEPAGDALPSREPRGVAAGGVVRQGRARASPGVTRRGAHGSGPGGYGWHGASGGRPRPRAIIPRRPRVRPEHEGGHGAQLPLPHGRRVADAGGAGASPETEGEGAAGEGAAEISCLFTSGGEAWRAVGGWGMPCYGSFVGPCRWRCRRF